MNPMSPEPNVKQAVQFFRVSDTFLSDPDGYRLELESLTDVPEETVLPAD